MLEIVLVTFRGNCLPAKLYIEPDEEMPPGLDIGAMHFAETPEDSLGRPVYRQVHVIDAEAS